MASSGPKRKEADVYDRQIRLWGAEAQAKMAQSKVLYVNITAASSEVIKNMVLAGIRAVLCDDRPFSSNMESTPTVFLSASDRSPENKKAKQTVAEALQPKIEELNPLLGDCQVVKQSELTDELLAGFTVVVCSRIDSIAQALQYSKATVAGGGKFFMVDSFGLMGGAVFDLGINHKYRPEIGKKVLQEETLTSYTPLEQLFKIPLGVPKKRYHKQPAGFWYQYRLLLEYVEQTKTWPTAASASDFVNKMQAWVAETAPALKDHDSLSSESLTTLATVATAEITPVCSVLGGMLGNEIIKAISGKGTPANNTFLFDGNSGKFWSYLVEP